MTEEAVVRPQAHADVDDVVAIYAAVAEEGRWIAAEAGFDLAERAARIRAWLDDPATFGGFVAEIDGRVVGSIGIHLASYGVAELGMCLLDGYRGRGLGRALLDAGITWARGAGAHKVALQVWPHNERAIALYRSAGFVEEGRLARHYRRGNGELWDAVVMGLPLEPG